MPNFYQNEDLLNNVYDFAVSAADGSTVGLDTYKGKAMLIVNVASKCGLTPQYEGLEALNIANADRGLQILGFPCNQFGGQEPGTSDEIAEFCSLTYNVTFPILGKIDVNGADADPLYSYLRAQDPGDFGPDSGPIFAHISKTKPEAIGTDEVKWNFTKFLVGRDGNVIRRYEPGVTPEEIAADLDAVLAS